MAFTTNNFTLEAKMAKMNMFIPLVSMAILIGLPSPSQSIGIDLTSSVGKDKQITLLAKSGSTVALNPTEIEKTKEITIPFNIKRTGYFTMPTVIPQAYPTQINFGKANPSKGWGLCLVKFTPKEDHSVEIVMKMSVMSMKPTKDFEPYPDDLKLPQAVKNATGEFLLDLPKSLLPGHYAIIGFNGGAGISFTKKNGVAWVFEVPVTEEPKPNTI